MRNKEKGYQIMQPITKKERFSNYYCYYLFWVAVGYYLWKKILSITGYRFHPTDFELLHFYLHNKNLGRDAMVQAIAEVEDICGLEPWELPGHSNIHSGDHVWYFFYRPNYKYRNSTRINRTTNEGYWKPTGDPRKIMARDQKTEIGKKRTLVFYKGRVGDRYKNKNKTGWIMHEYELTVTLPNHTTFVLCKLKRKYGKGEVPGIEEGEPSHYLPPNLGNYIANNAIPAEAARCLTDLSDPNEILAKLKLEVFNEHEMLEYQSTESWNSDFLGGFDPEKEDSHDLPFDWGSGVVENSVPDHQVLAEVPQDQSGTNERDSKFGDLVSAAETSNQHNLVSENDGFTMPNSSSENATAENSVQMDLANMPGQSTDELFAELEELSEVNHFHQVLAEVPQDQSGTNEQESKFWDLVSVAERNNQHNLVAENDGFTMTNSSSENATAEQSVKMDLADMHGQSTDELFEELEALPEVNRFVQGNGFGGSFHYWFSADEIFQELEIPNAPYNQSSTNEEEQSLTAAAANGGCSLSFEGINPSRKRPRTDSLGFSGDMNT